MSEILFICPEAGYELYNTLSKYFEVEIVDSDNGTMGVLDYLKVLVDPISKTVETLGNIIIEFINKDSCTITVKNGEKEMTFNGKMKGISNEDVINMVKEVFEG